MNKRNAILATLGAIGAAALAAQGCGGSEIPIAQNDTGLYGGQIDAGTGLCGSAVCGAGQLCCAGSDEYCSPTCMNVSQCPTYGRPCKAPDAGTPPPDSGGIDSAPPPPPPPTDGGACCPATYTMYACTFPDGGSGFACHNPQMGCASSTTCGVGCDPVVTGQCGVTSNLQWYWTCGDPVCRAPGPDASAPSCPTAGSPCTTKGQTCGDGSTTCGAVLVCDDHDPKSGGCPVSSAKFKDDIRYLGDAELAALHDETLSMRLTTYKYKGPWANGSDSTHLGFIIEDQPQSLSVERGHDRVDMYGYVSMVVASMQVQEKEIADLRKELAATRAACKVK